MGILLGGGNLLQSMEQAQGELEQRAMIPSLRQICEDRISEDLKIFSAAYPDLKSLLEEDQEGQAMAFFLYNMCEFSQSFWQSPFLSHLKKSLRNSYFNFLKKKRVPPHQTEKKATDSLGKLGFILGWMYGEGAGVEKDEQKAAQLYTQAASHGHGDALNNLALMYLKGQGVDKDEQKATALYSQAAAQGLPVAQFNLAGSYLDGTGVPKDDRKAATLFHQAAVQKVEAAYYILGTMYGEGRGVPQDMAKSIDFFKKAVAQGDERAQDVLENAYLPLH